MVAIANCRLGGLKQPKFISHSFEGLNPNIQMQVGLGPCEVTARVTSVAVGAFSLLCTCPVPLCEPELLLSGDTIMSGTTLLPCDLTQLQDLCSPVSKKPAHEPGAYL